MAEVVFQNMEGMLPELEELEREDVFTRQELRYNLYITMFLMSWKSLFVRDSSYCHHRAINDLNVVVLYFFHT